MVEEKRDRWKNVSLLDYWQQLRASASVCVCKKKRKGRQMEVGGDELTKIYMTLGELERKGYKRRYIKINGKKMNLLEMRRKNVEGGGGRKSTSMEKHVENREERSTMQGNWAYRRE